MKVGVFTFRQYPYVSANVAIGYTLAKEFAKREGTDVVLLGVKQDPAQDQVSEYQGMPIRFLNSEIHNSSRMENRMKRIFGEKCFLKKEAAGLRRIVEEEKIDVLLSVIAPIQVAYITELANLSIPCYLYQLDPYYNVGDVENPKLKRDFMVSISRFRHVFTTDLLQAVYLADPEISKFRQKFTVVEFPKLEQKPLQAPAAHEACPVTLLYAGSLYKTIRNPAILRHVKEQLPQESCVRFLGGCDDPQDEEQLRSAGIDCWGHCTPDIVEAQLAEADILINIGNTVRNQLGSKLIEYIATGKPILNIHQHCDDVTSAVLEKYRYKLDLSSQELQTEEARKKLSRFVRESAGKQESFSEIQKDYKAYTPEYVADVVYRKFTGIG